MESLIELDESHEPGGRGWVCQYRAGLETARAGGSSRLRWRKDGDSAFLDPRGGKSLMSGLARAGRADQGFGSVTLFDMPHKCPRTIWRPAKYVHVCIPGHECCSHFVRSVRNAGKDTRSPVPGTIVLSLSGHPLTLSRSLEIAKAPGPADVGKALELRISAEPDILDEDLVDRFCQNVQTDTLTASKHAML